MKGTLIFLVIVLIGGYLLYAKPWQEARYDESSQGQEAMKTDKIVDAAIGYPNIWEAREMLDSQPVHDGAKTLTFGSYDEFSQMVDALYTAGAKKVAFAYITRGSRSGDHAEGMYVVLPKEPSKRAALIAMAQSWPHPPKEVNQKYIYYRIAGWDVNDPEKSLLGS
ncbi:MAG TPA: hypothetical protein VFE58_08420 [Tepidisphaeraceae bacterium]|jgi:hypothetical protein|nr:hypothetical protein [Tepidisphaeraceae bacterium]